VRVWGADNPNKGMGQKTKNEFLHPKANLALSMILPATFQNFQPFPNILYEVRANHFFVGLNETSRRP